jgi:hypothetical protein
MAKMASQESFLMVPPGVVRESKVGEERNGGKI